MREKARRCGCVFVFIILCLTVSNARLHAACSFVTSGVFIDFDCPTDREELIRVPFYRLPVLGSPPVLQSTLETFAQPGRLTITATFVPGNTQSPSSTSFARLHYSTDNTFSNLNPTWDVILMTKKSGDTYEAQLPAFPSGTKLEYYVEAADCYADSGHGIFNNLVTQFRLAKSVRMGWENPSSPFTRRNLVGELNDLGFPFYEDALVIERNEAIDPDLDITTFRASMDSFGGSLNLFLELQVRGQIGAGTPDLSAANTYMVFIQNLDHPDDPRTWNIPEGLFAVLYFPNYGQTSGVIKYRTSVIDLETLYRTRQEEPVGPFAIPQSEASASVNYQYPSVGNILTMRVPPPTGLASTQGYAMVAATGKLYLSRMISIIDSIYPDNPLIALIVGGYPMIDLDHDRTNTVRVYKNRMKTVTVE